MFIRLNAFRKRRVLLPSVQCFPPEIDDDLGDKMKSNEQIIGNQSTFESDEINSPQEHPYVSV